MIERPPRFGSRRFREILIPAVKADLVGALAGLYWMATRRRVRGWSRLVVAAARGRHNYGHWISHGEVRTLAEFRATYPSTTGRAKIAVLLLDEDSTADAAETSIASIHATIGAATIYSVRGVRDGLRTLSRPDSLREAFSELADSDGADWLFPVVAGDRVSSELGDILGRFLTKRTEQLVYWDEDLLQFGVRTDPWVKPGWDPLLFGQLGGLLGASVVSFNAIRHSAGSLRASRVDRPEVERALLEFATAGSAGHIPLILTHRARRWVKGTAAAPLPPAPGRWPRVSIIIPSRDKPSLLAACLRGIEGTNYPGAIQVIIVDNGSREPEALQLLNGLAQNSRYKILQDAGDFNFARLNNLAARAADGEVLCLLNNDVEPLEPDWLTVLVRYALQRDVGAVGPQLVYPSGRIQHAGVAIGVGGAAGHLQKGVDPHDRRFWTWQAVTREVSALTAAVLVLRKSRFEEVGGFDEGFAVAFNDIDLCLRLKQRGLRNIYVADVRLLHRESESRGEDRRPAQARRFAGELAKLQERWGTEDYEDPHFSPLFCRLVEPCILAP